MPADFGGGGTATAGGAVAADAGPKVCDTWGRGDPSAFETVFAEVDSFMNSTLASALRVRDELAPGVGVALGEWGVSPKGDIDSMCYQVCPSSALCRPSLSDVAGAQALAYDTSFQLMAAAVMSYGCIHDRSFRFDQGRSSQRDQETQSWCGQGD